MNWKNLLTHPSELVRLDEQLKINFKQLSKFFPGTPGWTYDSFKILLQHKKMILNVRCFIVLFATEYFQYNIHSEEELYLLKAECNNLDSITASDEPIPPMEIEISSLSNGDLSKNSNVLFLNADNLDCEH